jgi:hypothetical protein
MWSEAIIRNSLIHSITATTIRSWVVFQGERVVLTGGRILGAGQDSSGVVNKVEKEMSTWSAEEVGNQVGKKRGDEKNQDSGCD